MSSTHTYTKVVEESLLSSLRCLHGMLENDPIQTRDQFSDLMKATFGSGYLDPRDISNEMGFNASTVYRWVEGKSAPHPSLWPRVQDWLIEAIFSKVKDLEKLHSADELAEV